MGLYHAITDNGAGGLSSSVGEMAEDTGGCVLDIAKAPLKYDGLRPWEILLSEAQERMTLACPRTNWSSFWSWLPVWTWRPRPWATLRNPVL